MTRQATEWIWRTVLLAVLIWIGEELHQLRSEVRPLPEDAAMTAEGQTEPADDMLQALDDLRDDVSVLNKKVDALLATMTRL